MVVKEMHIDVHLQLQKMNANVISSIKVEEIDWFLNQESRRFIKQRMSPRSNDKQLGFQDTKKRYEDLKSLYTPRNLTLYTHDSNSVFCYLPSDCIDLVDSRSYTKNLCGNTYNPTTSSETLYYSTYKFLDTGVASYKNFKYKINSTVVFDTSLYPQFVNGVASPDSKFELIDFMLEDLRRAGFEAKYENYIDIFARGSIIVVSKSTMTITVKYDTGSETSQTVLTKSFTKISTIIGTEDYKNRLPKTEDLENLLDSSFGTTKFDSPLISLEKDKLIIHHKKKFILDSVDIVYIRKPIKISLPLNQSCELDENVHPEIVDSTVKRLAGITSSDSYKYISNENLLKE